MERTQTGTLARVRKAPVMYSTFPFYDLHVGAGAGFYLNATNPKYSKHYNMLTHITTELPKVIEEAEIPIVRCLLLMSQFKCAEKSDHPRRTFRDNRSSDTRWVDTAH